MPVSSSETINLEISRSLHDSEKCKYMSMIIMKATQVIFTMNDSSFPLNFKKKNKLHFPL